jgi:hypothetical protein
VLQRRTDRSSPRQPAASGAPSSPLPSRERDTDDGDDLLRVDPLPRDIAAARTPSRSAKHAVSELRNESGAAWLAEQFELSVRRALQQPLAGAEQDGDDVQAQLVDQAGGKVLVDGRGAASDCDTPLAGHRARPFQRRLDALGDEVERRAANHLQGRALVVREDEHGRKAGAARPSRPRGGHPYARGRRVDAAFAGRVVGELFDDRRQAVIAC